VSQGAINEQIRVMNAGFSGAEGGFDTGFRFTLAGVDRTVNADWFNAGPSTKAERDMKQALSRAGRTRSTTTRPRPRSTSAGRTFPTS
jgi:hypothetical protein